MTEPAAPPARSRMWGFVFGLVLLAAVLAFLRDRGDEATFFGLLRHASPAWLLAGAALQIGTYACAAGIWGRVGAGRGPRIPLRDRMGLALGKLFVDQVFPTGGIGGSSLVVAGLRRRGLPLEVATACLLVDLLGFYLAHAVGIGLSLLTLGHLPEPLAVAAWAFVGLALAVPGAILSLARPGAPAFARRIPVLAQVASAPPELVRSPRLLVVSMLLQLGIVLLDAGTLECMLRALGTVPPLGATLAAFILAHIVVIVGFVPAGLGLFEGASVATLSLLHVPFEAGVAATLLLRSLTLWVPMAPGLWMARRELR